MKKPIRVAVTGPAGNIGYSLLFRIAAGDMFGPDQPVILQLLDRATPESQQKVKGVMMELDDCAFPLLAGLDNSPEATTAFRDADVALLVGARPRSKGMERADLLNANAEIFVAQGRALNETASRDCKVLVVGMDSLLTQLARCCHPVPPDEIVGYVTRGRGVMIHRADCPNLKNMVDQDHDRLIEVSWGRAGDDALYPADVLVIASDRSGIMKDVTEVMQREKVHVTALNTQILKGDQHMRFSLEVKGGNAMQGLLKGLRAVHGVLSARRL